MDKATFLKKLTEEEYKSETDIKSQKKSLTLSATNQLNEETSFFTELITLFSTEDNFPIQQLQSFKPDVIIHYLKTSHILYLTKKLPEIEQQLTQLSSRQGELTDTLASVMSWLQKNMEKHFRIEEQSLFPYIQDLALVHENKLNKKDFKLKYKDFSIQHFIDSHHDDVETKLAEVKKYIVRSLQSMEELFPYRVVLQKLDTLEKDMRLHAKIEDEVLVPMALEWEQPR